MSIHLDDAQHERSGGAPKATTPSREPRAAMVELSREDCLRLLAAHSFGRIVVAGERTPVIRPVNYIYDAVLRSVVFKTDFGSKFHYLLQSAEAAFEIDGIDAGSRTGWSVIIKGTTEKVTSPNEVRRLDGLCHETWAPGEKPHWVSIRAWTVSGRRIVLTVAPDGS